MSETQYSFCETATASGGTPWHIRKITDKGLKLGGGADTDALCGRKVCWDVPVRVSVANYKCCARCAEVFKAQQKAQVQK